MLNVMHRFASAAAAPIFLNLSMMATLALAAFFPGAGYAAAWGVLLAGILEFLLLAGDAAKTGMLPQIRAVRLDDDVRGVLSRTGACDHRFDGNADRAVRRHHHCDLSAGGRAFGAVLRRPSQSVADRRDRHRDRHRAAAGNVRRIAAERRRRRVGRAAAGVRILAVVFGAVRRRLPDRA